MAALSVDSDRLGTNVGISRRSPYDLKSARNRLFAETPPAMPMLLACQRRAASNVSSTPAIAALAARPSARSPGNRVVIQLEPGDRVTHDTFGLGTVVVVEGAGERAVASIDFRDSGVKRLLLRYAPVEKL